MGATEILEALEKGDKLTSSEIAERIECSTIATMTAIKRLLKDSSENVVFRVLTPEEKEKRYGRKVGSKIHLYWISK